MATTANLTKEFQQITSDGRVILREFSKPLLQNIFFRNKQYVLDNSTTVNFDQSIWEYNPQKFCLDYYNIPEIYPLIIFINDLKSLFEFSAENMNSKIITPEIYTLINVLTLQRI